jgi:hypothetical protein
MNLRRYLMSVEDRVVSVVAAWSRKPSPGDDDVLEQLWDNSGRAAPFQSDGQRQLIAALQEEFKKPSAVNVQLVPADLDPAGQIKTVNNLAVAIARMPSP